MYGIVVIDGREYIERPQQFNLDISVTSNLQLISGQALSLPGVADFLLKGLSREIMQDDAPVTDIRFRWRLGNSDGGVWYQSAGVAGTNDRTVDTNTFGTAQFPYPFIPGIFYSKGAAMTWEVQDMSSDVPYNIYVTFHGSELIPKG